MADLKHYNDSKECGSSGPNDFRAENQRLIHLVQQKDKKMKEMKTEFELFMNKLCSENRKLEQKLFENGESASLEKRKLEQENMEYKNNIDVLDDEVMCCRNQMAKFLNSFDLESYKKTVEEKDMELQRSEKKIEALTMRLRSLKDTNDGLVQEKEHLRDRLDQIKLVFNRAKIDVIEYCNEIRKYDEMALGMEKQLSRYNVILFKLQDQFRRASMEKNAMEKQAQELYSLLSEERTQHDCLKKDAKIMKEKILQNEKSLRDYKEKLDLATCELTSYKENLDRLKNKLEEKSKSLGYSDDRADVFQIKTRSQTCGPCHDKRMLSQKIKYKLEDTLNHHSSNGTGTSSSRKSSLKNSPRPISTNTNRILAGVSNTLRKHNIYSTSETSSTNT